MVFRSIFITFLRIRMQIYLFSFRYIENLYYLCIVILKRVTRKGAHSCA